MTMSRVISLKNRYLPQTYNKSINEVRKKLGNDHLWVSSDETTDTSKRSIAIFVVGSLDNENNGPYELHFDVLPSTNSEGIQKFFRDSLALLFEGIYYNSILCFL